MLMTDYTAEFLNLEDVIITNVENISDQLHIYIELPRSEHICPACGAVTARIHDYRWQKIKDVPMGRDTFLHLRKRRYRCNCGKRFFRKKQLSPSLLQSYKPPRGRDYLCLQESCVCQRDRLSVQCFRCDGYAVFSILQPQTRNTS